MAETAQRVTVQYAGQQIEVQDIGGLFATPRHPYTAALLDSLPERSQGRRLPTIPGVVPGLTDRPEGCLFHPRCAWATELCQTRAPELTGDEVTVRCHYPLRDGAPTGHPRVRGGAV